MLSYTTSDISVVVYVIRARTQSFGSNEIPDVLNVLGNSERSSQALGIQKAADEVNADHPARRGHRFDRLIRYVAVDRLMRENRTDYRSNTGGIPETLSHPLAVAASRIQSALVPLS
jgi:hypothetical protein